MNQLMNLLFQNYIIDRCELLLKVLASKKMRRHYPSFLVRISQVEAVNYPILNSASKLHSVPLRHSF